jgi:prepilin-type N-terminal cleavage/methylation domain-containing protein
MENKITNNKKDRLLTGFTLIELIVSMAIFLLTIGVAVTIFVYIANHQRRILSEQELLNQISYVQEYISKALRMARTATYQEDADCLGDLGNIYLLTRPDTAGFYRGVKFINQTDNDSCHEIFFDNITDSQNPVLKELKNSRNDANAVALTSKNMKIEFVRFGVNGSDGSTSSGSGASTQDDIQPRITIVFGAKILGTEDEPIRIFQTTVSQRNLNVK